MPEGTSVTPAAPSLERQSTTRVAVYTDHLFWRQDGELYSDRSFPGFVARLAPLVGSLVFLARVDPAPGAAQHKLPAGTEVMEMPFVGSLSNPIDVVRMMAGSIRRFWRVLDRVDAVWLVGSYLISFVFAAIAAARGKRVVLGVRQDLPSMPAADIRGGAGSIWSRMRWKACTGCSPACSRSWSSDPASPATSAALARCCSCPCRSCPRTTSSAASRPWHAPTTAS